MPQAFRTAYTPAPEREKLSELRAKTDEQLLKIIHSKLELGLNFLALVEEKYSGGNRDHAEQLLRRVKQTVIEVKQLLVVLRDDQRRGFGPQLNKLEKALEQFDRNRDRPRSATASMP